jgi:predicted DNA-binding transcriptional regulator AlpA
VNADRVAAPPDPLGKPVINRQDFVALMEVSDRTFRRMMKRKHFPRPLPTGGRLLKWSSAAVRKFLEGR